MSTYSNIFFNSVFVLIPIAYVTIQEWLKSSVREAQLVLDKRNTEVNFLKSQVNPHFLFNALNTVYGLSIKENAVKTTQSVSQLSKMMRYTFMSSESSKVLLTEEIIYLKNYIEFQMLRIVDKEQISLETQFEYDEDYTIEPLLFIPIVENAFKYGIDTKHGSMIQIKLKAEKNSLIFNVNNSITTQKPSIKHSSGIGLKNLERRLMLVYPKNHHLLYEKKEQSFSVLLELVL